MTRRLTHPKEKPTYPRNPKTPSIRGYFENPGKKQVFFTLPLGGSKGILRVNHVAELLRIRESRRSRWASYNVMGLLASGFEKPHEARKIEIGRLIYTPEN